MYNIASHIELKVVHDVGSSELIRTHTHTHTHAHTHTHTYIFAYKK